MDECRHWPCPVFAAAKQRIKRLLLALTIHEEKYGSRSAYRCYSHRQAPLGDFFRLGIKAALSLPSQISKVSNAGS